MRTLAMLLLPACGLLAQDFVIFRAPGSAPEEQLTRYLNAIGQRHLDARDRAIAQIKTREQAEQRKQAVREKILRLIGGLPDSRGPLNVKNYGTLDEGEYRIEKIVYESLPGFYVPANVYVPKRGAGPFPAVLMPVGHGRDGKAGSRQIATGLVLKGFITLAYDPIGQGERSQYYDAVLGASRVGGPTDEHSHANGHTLLIGDNVARYRIWDGMRGIDYLLTRKDVDPARIGCTGCSGGGTLTTYIAALDERVKAAAPACYINSWQELLTGPGPQDGEQTFPGFLSEGLNMADFAELFAPKPWLIVSTIQDFFPLEGARQFYEEAKRWYRLYAAEDRVQWHVGPGGHGTPQPSREAIYAWFEKWLRNGPGYAEEPAMKSPSPDSLLVTATGQVADSLGGETVFTLNRRRAADLVAPRRPRDPSQLAAAVRELNFVSLQPGGAPPALTVHSTALRDGYRLEVVSFESERGIHIPGLLLVPDSPAVKPAVLVADPRSKQEQAAPGGDLEELARGGHVVFAIQPRGLPETPRTSRSPLGEYSAHMRAAVVGKSLVGMRVEDLLRAMDYLASRSDVNRSRVAAFGQGSQAVPLLHAAVLDSRISSLVLQDCLPLYRLAIERPIHRNLYDVAIPGVLRKYDLDDLLLAVRPRPVSLLNPLDAAGNPLRLDELRKLLGPAAEQVRLGYRGRRDPLAPYLGGTGSF